QGPLDADRGAVQQPLQLGGLAGALDAEGGVQVEVELAGDVDQADHGVVALEDGARVHRAGRVVGRGLVLVGEEAGQLRAAAGDGRVVQHVPPQTGGFGAGGHHVVHGREGGAGEEHPGGVGVGEV